MPQNNQDSLDHDDIFLDPDDDEGLPNNQPAKAGGQTGRLGRAKVPFVRVSLPWILDQSLFSAKARLFLLLLHESRWGQRRVHLTGAMAARVGLSKRTKNNNVRQLECEGWVLVERSGKAACDVTVVVDRT
jgi:hypothetical protein